MSDPEALPTAGDERLLLIHYGELSLKGKNRNQFEDRLIANLRELLGDLLEGGPDRPRGRLIWKLAPTAAIEDVVTRMGWVYGVANFAIAVTCPLELEAFTAEAVALANRVAPASFAIRSRRAEKKFALNSNEVNRKVGASVQAATGARVELEHPELTIRIDLLSDRALVFSAPYPGAGGLPVGCAGKVTVLLSGGIDSPVAAELMMKRGCSVRFLHFHSAPFTDIASQEKVIELAKIVARGQGRAIVDMIPFVGIQQEIIAHAPAEPRVLLYRRFMVRIAAEAAKRHHSLALVTGESLGQVASQTLHNMGAIDAVAPLPILRPLITYDKQEIVDRARVIGTYELSIQPHGDCCSFMMPPKVATKSSAERLDDAERDLDVDALVARALELMTSEEITAEVSLSSG